MSQWYLKDVEECWRIVFQWYLARMGSKLSLSLWDTFWPTNKHYIRETCAENRHIPTCVQISSACLLFIGVFWVGICLVLRALEVSCVTIAMYSHNFPEWHQGNITSFFGAMIILTNSGAIRMFRDHVEGTMSRNTKIRQNINVTWLNWQGHDNIDQDPSSFKGHSDADWPQWYWGASQHNIQGP